MIAAFVVPEKKREYIDREAVRKIVCEDCERIFPDIPCEPSECLLLSALKKLPAADVRSVKRGRWVEHYETYDCHPEWGEVQYGYICSLCGRWEYEREPFCNCGAVMEGTE